MILHFTEWHFEILLWKNPAALLPPPPSSFRFKALAMTSQCVWILSISILRIDQTKGIQ